MKLYHYYDESTGPFKNLSDLDIKEAEIILDKLRSESKGFASKRSKEYLGIRQELEEKARLLFIKKGGKPTRRAPHYMTLGSCPWLLEWFENGCELSIPIENFDPSTVSFTYGDLFPTMRIQDGKKYRGQVYSLDEINELVTELGFPQDWNPYGDKGPERYIEAQIWDNNPLALIGGDSSMVNVRKANEADLSRVVELSELWVSECITYGLGANTEEILRNYFGDYFWVAEIDSVVVGYITGTIHESDGLAVIEKGECYLEVDEVYVHPDYRSDNIGHAMVDKLLQTADSNGITRATVYSASMQWQKIVGFYEKHGFKMWFVQMYR